MPRAADQKGSGDRRSRSTWVRFEPPPILDWIEEHRVFLLTALATVLTIAFGLVLPFFGYNLSWAPHRLFKVVAGGALVTILLMRPTWMPYIFCFVFPFAAWLPKSPITMLNTANLLALSSFFGIAILTLRKRITPVVPSTLNLPLVLFLVWICLSAVYGAYLYPNPIPMSVRLRNLWGILTAFLVFFAVTHLVLDRKQLWRVITFLMIGCTLGLLGPLREVAENGFGVRTAGGVGDINRMGAFIAMAGIFAFLMIPAYRGISKFGTVLAAAAQVVGLILPNSRGAYAGFLLASAPQALRTSLLGSLLIFGLIGTSPLWAPDFVKYRVFATMEAASADDRTKAIDADSGGRLEVWEVLLGVIARNPVAGIGFGNLNNEVETQLGYRKAGHNLYLEVAVEMGIPGLVLLLWIFYRCWRLGRVLIARGGRGAILGRAFLGVLFCLMFVNVFGQRLFDFSLAGFFCLLAAVVSAEERMTRESALEVKE